MEVMIECPGTDVDEKGNLKLANEPGVDARISIFHGSPYAETDVCPKRKGNIYCRSEGIDCFVHRLRTGGKLIGRDGNYISTIKEAISVLTVRLDKVKIGA